VAGIVRNAINGADFAALRLGMMTDTLCAEVGIDHIDLFAGRDGAIRTFRFAHVAVDAFVRDY